MNELGLGMVFSAKDLASGVMSKVSKGILDVEGRSSQTGKAVAQHFQAFSVGLATLGTGASLLGTAFGLAGVSGKFNEQVAAVGAVANANAEELKLLHDAAIDAGVATQFAPTEAVIGLGDLAQAGYNAQESIALLNPVLNLAAGSLGQLSPSGAAGLASQTMKAFKIPIEQAGITMDKLLQSVNAFALSANELPLALGTASRGASAMNQSLDETLIALGLVKNVVPSVERASTAVAVAMEKMVDPATAAALKGQGVAVADSAGKFRPFLDVISDLIPALGKMGTEQKRAAFLVKTFGTEALGGVQAILGQVTNGIRDNTGATVTGAAAIAFLRKQFLEAGGTAQTFANKLLDTFEGQKKLLGGSMETLAIILGEPFEKALKPVVSAVLGILNGILSFVKSMPEGMKNFLAKLVLVVGSVLSIVGAFIAAKAAIAIFVSGMGAIGVSVGGVIATLAPALLVIGLLVGAVYAFKYAVDNNLGGIGDKFKATVEKIKLFFDALQQLFTDGGFSGAVLEEFQKGENSAINFAIKLYVVANRVVGFFEGMGRGITGVLDQAQPSFDAFMRAIDGLGTAFGGLGGQIDTLSNQTALDDAGTSGESAGKALGKVLVALVNVLTVATEALTGFTTQMDKMGTAVAPVKDSISAVVDELAEVSQVLGLTKNSVDGTAGGWTEFGAAVGSVITLILGAIRGLVSIGGGMLSGFASIFAGIIEVIAGLINGDFERAFRGIFRIVYGAIRAATAPLLGLVETIAGVIDALRNINGGTSNLAGTVADFRKNVFAGLHETLDLGKQTTNDAPTPPKGGGDTMPKELVDFYTLPTSNDLPFAPTVENVAAGQAAQAGAASADIAGLNSSIQELRSAKQGDMTVDATMMVNEDVLGKISIKAAAAQKASGGGITPVHVQ